MEKNKNNFGIPEVDNTPTGIVEMEGRFFRGISDSSKQRPSWVRICAIIFSIIALLFPGISFLTIAITLYPSIYNDNGIFGFVMITLFGLLFTAGGIIGIKKNRKRK